MTSRFTAGEFTSFMLLLCLVLVFWLTYFDIAPEDFENNAPDRERDPGLRKAHIILLLVFPFLTILPINGLNRCFNLNLAWWEWIILLPFVSLFNLSFLLFGYVFANFRDLDIGKYLLWMLVGIGLTFSPLYTILRAVNTDLLWLQLILGLLSLPLFFTALLRGLVGIFNINDDTKFAINSMLLAGGCLVVGIVLVVLATNTNIQTKLDISQLSPSNFWGQEAKLKKKIAELSELQESLDKKQKEVADLIITYNSEIDTLIKEIKTDQSQDNVKTFSQAQKHPRIAYDLSLIQRKKAYIAKLEDTQVRLRNGTFELQFLERQVDDDLRLYKTLPEKEVTELVSKVTKVIDQYLPEASELALNIDPNSMPSAESIWQEINKTK